MQSNYQNSINTALKELATTKSISSGLLVCNTLLEHMGIETKTVEDIELSKIKLPNAERYDRWFDAHPHFRGDRACFDLTPKVDLLEAKFYALQKRSRLFIAGSVTFTPNFEDREYTRTDPSMKVGIDFFLTPEKDAVIVVLSSKGSLRLVELSGRLTNTQHEIFTIWHNVAQLADKNALHTTIWESFKLSSLNKKFYEGITNSFTTLTQHLQKGGVEEQLANQFANRLHGRLLFLWFLRKKKIINETKEYFTLGDQGDMKYYTNKLSTLFFNVLNNEDHRDVDPVTPYLNGGLFDQDADGAYWKTHSPTFPTGFFKTLYDHFDSFNFTTDESTPEYEQIAIDPEMLGRIFESFLATLKTETGAQAKKANGAFYTPREIVGYMSRESLRQYLYTSLDAREALKSSIDELLDRPDSEWALAGTNSKRDTVAKEDRERIMDALRNIRVLDPAVGSGAFPMGVLHKILSIFERLDPNFDSYETKLSILRNNIYGVDIDPTAIEIARLRAWLSIIVDVEETKKIKPLPNLDFKFVCADTLIGLTKSNASFTTDETLKPTLMRIRDEYYATSSKIKKDKLQKEYLKLTHKESLFDTEETRQLKSYRPFDVGSSTSFYDPELMHGVSIFDVVIGNPPYIQLSKTKITVTTKEYLINRFKTSSGRLNTFGFFILHGIDLVKVGGITTFIIPNTLLSQEYYEYIRRYILDHTNVVEIVEYDKMLFEFAVVENITLFLQKRDGDTNNGSGTKISKQDGDKVVTTKTIDQSGFYGAYKNQFDLKGDVVTNKLQTLENSIPLSTICNINQAIALKGDRSKSLLENPMQDKEVYKLLDGRNIQKYHVDWGGVYLDYDVSKIHSCKRKDIFLQKEKLLFRRVSNKLVFAYDNQQYFALNTLVVLTHKDGFEKQYPIKFLLALLNSKLINYYYFNKYKSSKKVFSEIQARSVGLIPVPVINTKDQKEVVGQMNLLAEQIMTKKASQKTETKNLEDQVDALVCKLYGLSEEEINIIEQSK